MFGHVLAYRLKCLLRDRELVFWTLLFPLLLATFFYFAFGHLTSAQEKFDPVNTVVVDNRAYRQDDRFRQVMESLSKEGKNQMLNLTVAGEEQAEKLLEEGAVVGIVIPGDPVRLTVRQSGLQQSILKAILDEYAHTTQTLTTIISRDRGVARQLIKELENRRSYSEQVSFSDAMPDTMLAYFYALIAMACLYSAFWGLRNTIDLQADLSPRGARRGVAPTHKLKVVISDSLAALIISSLEVLLLLAYLALVLKISFGHQLGYVLLTCLAGCVTGVSFGNFIGTMIRAGEGVKIGILIGGSMVMSFLAGLMFVDMKYIIAVKAPFLSYINPAALISDAFYSLYLFDSHSRFFTNIGMLCLLSVVMSVLSIWRLRRERYAGI